MSGAADGEGRLAGKVALITGAARGTGEATARAMVREGARVVLGDVSDAAGEKVAAELGDAAAYVHLDVREERDWNAAVRAATDRFGRLDVLVNNAAVLLIRSIADTSRDDLMRLVEVNQLGPFLGIRAVIEPMTAAGGGSIVNVVSTDGIKGMNGVGAYASTKWALRGITRVAAMELGRRRIRVNAVCPEIGSKEMSEPFLPEGTDMEQATEVGVGKILPAPPGYTHRDRLEDVVQMIVFLASDLSRSCTAQDFIVDGGLTAGYLEPRIPGGD